MANFTERRFYLGAVPLALSLGCGYASRAPPIGDSGTRFEAYDISRGGGGRTGGGERVGIGDRMDYEARELNMLELEPGATTPFRGPTFHHIEALEHLLDQDRASLTR